MTMCDIIQAVLYTSVLGVAGLLCFIWAKKRVRLIPGIDQGFEKQAKILDEHLDFHQRIISCDKCGCLVDKTIAVEGTHRIEKRPISKWEQSFMEEYVHIPYLCKGCAKNDK